MTFGGPFGFPHSATALSGYPAGRWQLVRSARRISIRPSVRRPSVVPHVSLKLPHPGPGAAAAAAFRRCRGTRPPVTPTQACRRTRADGSGVAWSVRGPRTASEDPPEIRSLAAVGTVVGGGDARLVAVHCNRRRRCQTHHTLVSHIRTFRALRIPHCLQSTILYNEFAIIPPHRVGRKTINQRWNISPSHDFNQYQPILKMETYIIFIFMLSTRHIYITYINHIISIHVIVYG